jgi:RNA polymerase sigma-70 factor, ECF subfamily
VDVIGRRPKRVLPMDYAPATDPAQEPGQPVTESVWVEPYPEQVPDGRAAPDARYEQRESVELAFVAALQHLPARQRAVLIMREVLGFSAAEVSESLDTTVASVNSALQRARHAVDERLPERSQQENLRALGDEAIEDVVERYMQAWERNDVDAVVELLAEDATIAMPPLASWYGGRASVARFLAASPMSGAWRWRVVRTRANGQPALAYYVWDQDAGAYLPFALNVLAFAGDRIKDITAFVVRTTEFERFDRWPEAPQATAIFERFGLPERL